MNPLNETELAWSAGFFDGEGNIRFGNQLRVSGNRSRTYGSIRLQIAQVDKYVLDRFRKAVKNLGSVTGPYISKQANKKPVYSYTASGSEAINAFNLIKSYLSPIKLKQGKIAISKDRLQKSRPKLGNGMVQRLRIKSYAT